MILFQRFVYLHKINFKCKRATSNFSSWLNFIQSDLNSKKIIVQPNRTWFSWGRNGNPIRSHEELFQQTFVKLHPVWNVLIKVSVKNIWNQERIISITNANKAVALMQMGVKSTHWLLLKRETIPIKHLINRKGDIGIFWSLHVYALRKVLFWKG